MAGQVEDVSETVRILQDAGIRVSLFIDPDKPQVEASAETGAKMIELHTGAFANAEGTARKDELERLIAGAKQGHEIGLQINAGHGITTENLEELFQVPHMQELNIGHHLVSQAVFLGLSQSVKQMRELMNAYPE